MKHQLNIGFIIFAMLAMVSVAKAGDSYIGIDQSVATVTLPRTEGDINMLRGRFGVVILPESSSKFGLESHMAFGLDTYSTTRNEIDSNGTGQDIAIELEMESILGLYMRAEFLSAGRVGLYGLVGVAAAQTGPALQATNANGDLKFEQILVFDGDGNPVLDGNGAQETTNGDPIYNKDSSTGFSFGVGLTIFIGKSVSLQIESLQVLSGTSELDFDVSSVNIGLNIEL